MEWASELDVVDCDNGVKTPAASSLMISVKGLAENPDLSASQYPTGCANYVTVYEIRRLRHVNEISHKVIKLSANYPSPWKLWLGPKLVLIFDDPESIEFLSKSSNGYEKSSAYEFVKYCLDSLLESDLNLQSNPDCKLDEYLSKGIEITTQRVLKFWLRPNILFNNSSKGKRLQEYLSHVNKITSEIIKKKKESMHKDNFTQEGEGPYSRKDTSSFLDAIFKLFYETGEYSEADIRDEINTMVLTGSDTATNTLSFLFLMLATFTDIQNQVYEELYDLYGSSDIKDVSITMEDTKKMKYLE
ncbi:cytochrome P450 4C1-like [Polistes fuscatus]|uniref:cytochrome P450 4C1-like n=1 Tax=Polistes fuscatus TaxID=30207 RepID=UPI001CA8B602|nr:cytochrome P450 4C1-like [Polistes fuscatus]